MSEQRMFRASNTRSVYMFPLWVIAKLRDIKLSKIVWDKRLQVNCFCVQNFITYDKIKYEYELILRTISAKAFKFFYPPTTLWKTAKMIKLITYRKRNVSSGFLFFFLSARISQQNPGKASKSKTNPEPTLQNRIIIQSYTSCEPSTDTNRTKIWRWWYTTPSSLGFEKS